MIGEAIGTIVVLAFAALVVAWVITKIRKIWREGNK